jgi:hypothetical protein
LVNQIKFWAKCSAKREIFPSKIWVQQISHYKVSETRKRVAKSSATQIDNTIARRADLWAGIADCAVSGEVDMESANQKPSSFLIGDVF